MATYSPSQYGAAMARPAAAGGALDGGLFGRIMAAREDVATEKDAMLAAEYERRIRDEESKEDQKRAEEEKASEALANKLHYEEKDELLAHRMEQEERKVAEREARARAEREQADAEAAQKFVEEEKAAMEEVEDQARKDAQMALDLQSEEVKEVESALSELSTMWKKPKIKVDNEEDGIRITLHLPWLKTVNVEIDDETKIIVVKAQPDFSHLQTKCAHLPDDMCLDDVNITLDLKIVGKETVDRDEVTTEYDRRTSVCTVRVKNAYVKNEKKESFLGRVKGSFRRMLSKRSMDS